MKFSSLKLHFLKFYLENSSLRIVEDFQQNRQRRFVWPSSTCVDHCKRPAVGQKKLPESSSVLSPALSHPQQHSFSNPTERCFQFAQRPCRGDSNGPDTPTHTLSLSLHVTHTVASCLSPAHTHLLRGGSSLTKCGGGEVFLKSLQLECSDCDLG